MDLASWVTMYALCDAPVAVTHLINHDAGIMGDAPERELPAQRFTVRLKGATGVDG
ncbi:MAG: hypothetical protein AAGH19_08365 [Pseudomonadota bacterium]